MRYVTRYGQYFKIEDTGKKWPISKEEFLAAGNVPYKNADPLKTLRSYSTMEEAITGEETDDDSSDHESEWED